MLILAFWRVELHLCALSLVAYLCRRRAPSSGPDRRGFAQPDAPDHTHQAILPFLIFGTLNLNMEKFFKSILREVCYGKGLQ